MTTAMPITSVGKYAFEPRWNARTVNRLLAGSEIEIARESIDDDVSCVSIPLVLSVEARSAMTAAFAPNHFKRTWGFRRPLLALLLLAQAARCYLLTG